MAPVPIRLLRKTTPLRARKRKRSMAVEFIAERGAATKKSASKGLLAALRGI
jgi:hypothetical protein